jgi:hypothetical protein
VILDAALKRAGHEGGFGTLIFVSQRLCGKLHHRAPERLDDGEGRMDVAAWLRFGVSPTTACSCAAPSPIRSATSTSLWRSRPAPATASRLRCRPPERPPSRAAVRGGHRLDQLQTGAHRPLGIVLIGARIAEIGEHPVPHILGDKPAGALCRRSAAAEGAAPGAGISAGSSAMGNGEAPSPGAAIAFSSFRRGPSGGPSVARCRLVSLQPQTTPP